MVEASEDPEKRVGKGAILKHTHTCKKKGKKMQGIHRVELKSVDSSDQAATDREIQSDDGCRTTISASRLRTCGGR